MQLSRDVLMRNNPATYSFLDGNRVVMSYRNMRHKNIKLKSVTVTCVDYLLKNRQN